MLSADPKYELDALANKDFKFLTEVPAARKLEKKDWLDRTRRPENRNGLD